MTDIEVDNNSCILEVLLDVLQLHHLTLFVPARYLADTVVVLAMSGTEVCNELVEPLATTVISHIVRWDITSVHGEKCNN